MTGAHRPARLRLRRRLLAVSALPVIVVLVFAVKSISVVVLGDSAREHYAAGELAAMRDDVSALAGARRGGAGHHRIRGGRTGGARGPARRRRRAVLRVVGPLGRRRFVPGPGGSRARPRAAGRRRRLGGAAGRRAGTLRQRAGRHRRRPGRAASRTTTIPTRSGGRCAMDAAGRIAAKLRALGTVAPLAPPVPPPPADGAAPAAPPVAAPERPRHPRHGGSTRPTAIRSRPCSSCCGTRRTVKPARRRTSTRRPRRRPPAAGRFP